MNDDPNKNRLFALRGAISVEENTEAAILSATSELMSEVIERNDLDAEQMVSCVFSCTSGPERPVPRGRGP